MKKLKCFLGRLIFYYLLLPLIFIGMRIMQYVLLNQKEENIPDNPIIDNNESRRFVAKVNSIMKKLKKSFRRLFIGLFVILLILVLNTARYYWFHQDKDIAPSTPYIIQQHQTTTYSLDSLQTLYGLNKKLPKGYELQALLALAHYPELKDRHISFIVKETLIPLASRPALWSMLYHKPDWVYQVIISSKSMKKLEPILLKNLSFESQVGILGHELAHTLYYQDKGFWDILAIGGCYMMSDFRADFEKKTDKRAIAYGLGWQLLHYAKEVRSPEKLGQSDKDFTDKYYLNPVEIEAYMQELGNYNMP